MKWESGYYKGNLFCSKKWKGIFCEFEIVHSSHQRRIELSSTTLHAFNCVFSSFHFYFLYLLKGELSLCNQLYVLMFFYFTVGSTSLLRLGEVIHLWRINYAVPALILQTVSGWTLFFFLFHLFFPEYTKIDLSAFPW